jgi:phosphoesterase RecJ-like protein
MYHNLSHREKIDALLQLIGDRQRFLVSSHARPDGDAIGSSLGLMHLLESLGKEVVVAFSDPIPVIYRMLSGVDRIVRTLPTTPPDALILLECDCSARTGFTSAEFADMGKVFTINIDHHLSGGNCGDFNWIQPEASAVGSLVYDLAVASGVDITPEMATCLYTAVLTDTGSFTYASTRASTFALAEHLVERGANPNRIAQAVYYSNPPSKFHLLGAALRHMRVELPIAWAWITLDDMDSVDATVEDSEGIVNYLIGIGGVEAAVFLRQLPDEAGIRLSLRSKEGVDVAQVAENFGGGGHRNASGCTLPGPMSAAMDCILTHLRAQVSAQTLLA